jgi:hypothetical protein
MHHLSDSKEWVMRLTNVFILFKLLISRLLLHLKNHSSHSQNTNYRDDDRLFDLFDWFIIIDYFADDKPDENDDKNNDNDDDDDNLSMYMYLQFTGIQWNLLKKDTLGTSQKVSLNQRCPHFRVHFALKTAVWDQWMCPHFTGCPHFAGLLFTSFY